MTSGGRSVAEPSVHGSVRATAAAGKPLRVAPVALLRNSATAAAVWYSWSYSGVAAGSIWLRGACHAK